MDKKTDRILERVKKMLALSKNNPSENEAETALLRAQELLAKYNMSLNDVEDSEKNDMKKVIKENVMNPTGRLSWWKKQLAYVITSNFKCKYYINVVGRRLRSITFVGLEEDVLVASNVFRYAEEVVDKMAKSYVGKVYRSGESTKGIRNQFIMGFISGLQDKFREQVEKNDWGLIILTDKLVNEEYANLNLRKASNSGIQPKFARDDKARSEGYKSGQNFADSSKRKGIE